MWFLTVTGKALNSKTDLCKRIITYIKMVIGSLTNFTGIFKYTLIIVFCPVIMSEVAYSIGYPDTMSAAYHILKKATLSEVAWWYSDEP